MTKIATFTFALACLLAMTGTAFAGPPLATPDTAELTIAELFAAPETTTRIGCAPSATVEEGGQQMAQPTFSCGSCSPSPDCAGQTTDYVCWVEGRGYGKCGLYMGIQCSDGSGVDCYCYLPGDIIP